MSHRQAAAKALHYVVSTTVYYTSPIDAILSVGKWKEVYTTHSCLPIVF